MKVRSELWSMDMFVESAEGSVMATSSLSGSSNGRTLRPTACPLAVATRENTQERQLWVM